MGEEGKLLFSSIFFLHYLTNYKMALYKSPSAIKISIIGFIKHMLSPKSVKAIDKILSPCCQLELSDLDITCTGANLATVVVTLGQSISFPGTIKYLLLSDLDGKVGSGTFTNGSSTITITNGNVATAGTAVYTLYLYFYTNSDLNIGVFESATITVTNPNCT